MTREKAIRIMQNINPGCGDCDEAIETFVALGMLKLDEPKNGLTIAEKRAHGRAYKELDDQGFHATQIISLLDAAGLQIIEKQER